MEVGEEDGTLPAQHTTFNTLDNWGHKTPTQSKKKRTGKKGLKGHGPEHVHNTLGYIRKTTAAARTVLPIDTSIFVCLKNGIAACCLGFVGDTPILIHAIKLLCTISDNP